VDVTITVNRAELGKALAFASLGLPRYAAVPVLHGMRVTAGPGALELGTFDYETHASVKVAGEGAAGTAGTLVTGSELATAVSSLPTGKGTEGGEGTDKVTVTVTGDGLGLLCDGWRVNVPAMPAEAVAEYPAFPSLPPLTGTVAGDAFSRSAARIAACASKDDTLPELTCVKMTSQNGALEMAATDRYKLAADSQPIAAVTDGANLVPAVLLAKFAKACDKAGKVSVHLGGKLGAEHVAFSDGTRTLVTRAVTGEFIRYADKLTGEYPTVVTADAAALSAVVARAGKVTGRNEPVRFGVTAAGVTLTALRDRKVAGTQLVPATLTGPPAETGFNPGYLASVLAGISGTVTLELPADAGKKPARVTSGDGFTAVLMPLRLPESPYSKAAA
jgi:DNA polymerase-3 subunit beta